MPKINTKSGFTLIELSLSLVFIGILSLTVAFIINDTVASYRRGVTLSRVNTTGIDIVDDIRAAIQNSSTKSVKDDCSIVYGELQTSGGSIANQDKTACEENNASGFVYAVRSGVVTLKNGKTLADIPLYGAFCTGTYSYLWNTGYFFATDSVASVKPEGALRIKYKYTDPADEESEIKDQESSNFRLLKVRDTTRAVCISITSNNDLNKKKYGNPLDSNIIDITGTSEIIEEEPIDLLASDEASSGLALYNLFVSGPAESTAKNAMFYSASFILGTVQGGIDIKKTGNFCATPDDYEVENFDYCSINKFNFAAQATGE